MTCSGAEETSAFLSLAGALASSCWLGWSCDGGDKGQSERTAQSRLSASMLGQHAESVRVDIRPGRWGGKTCPGIHTLPSLRASVRMGCSPVRSHMKSTLNTYKLCLQRSNQEELGRKACLQTVQQTDPRNVYCLNEKESLFSYRRLLPVHMGQPWIQTDQHGCNRPVVSSFSDFAGLWGNPVCLFFPMTDLSLPKAPRSKKSLS